MSLVNNTKRHTWCPNNQNHQELGAATSVPACRKPNKSPINSLQAEDKPFTLLPSFLHQLFIFAAKFCWITLLLISFRNHDRGYPEFITYTCKMVIFMLSYMSVGSFYNVNSTIRSTVTIIYQFVFCKGLVTAKRTTRRKPCWYACFPFSDYSTCLRQNCLSPHTRMHWLLQMKFRMKGNKKNSEIVFNSVEPQQKER